MAKRPRKPRGEGTTRRAAGPRKPAVPSVASQLPPVSNAQVEAAERKFAEGIVARGQAVEEGQPLPPGATHVIVGRRDDGTPILRRVRYSMG